MTAEQLRATAIQASYRALVDHWSEAGGWSGGVTFDSLAETALDAVTPVLHRAWADEVADLRAAVAGAEQAAAALRKLHWDYEGRCANCITWCDCDSDIVDRHQHNVPWPCPTIKALAADVPAAADELSCPCPAVGVFAKDCPQHGDHPDAVPAAPTLPAGLDVHTADLARQAIAVVRAEGDNGRSVLIRTLKLMRERIRDEGGDFALKPLIPYAEWAMGQTADVPAAADHEHPGGYLSTACLHELHEPECGAAQRARGYVGHPTCKFCGAKCSCPCHTGGRVERAERVHADGCTLAADDPHHAGWCVLPLDPPADDPYWCDAEGHLTPLERISDGWARCSRCGERFLSGVPAAGEAEVTQP